jgi:sugar diacid utilization regulator
MVSPAVENGGLLPPAPGIYMPVRLGDDLAAILFARGEPDSIRTKAATAAAVTGLALEFASGATASMRQTLGPDLALRALLRGTQQEARRATLLVKVAGWDLFAPRVALVITPPSINERLPDAGIAVLRELLLAVADNAPSGQLSATEWVALPPLPRLEAQPSIQKVAEEIQKALESQGVPVIIGLGETHIDLPILTGLRRSYREAAFCAQTARQMSAAGGVHSLRSLGPLAFFAPSGQARAQVAQRLLEPLRAAPEILETVRVFLETDLSLEATAKRSGQHRHTVRSHLQRVRELTGLDPRSLTDAVQLKLALLILPIQTV